MPDTLFQGIFDTQLTAVIAPEQFLLCVGASLVIGLVLCAMMLWAHPAPAPGFAVSPGYPAGGGVRGHYDGQRQCRGRRSGGGGLQPGALPLCPWLRREIGAIFAAMGAG